MKFTKIACTLLCSVALFCGCAKNSDVVLKINDKEITRAEFYEDFNKIKNSQFKNAPKELQKDDSYLVLSLKERYLNDVITRELLAQEYEKRKIEASEEEVKNKKQQVIAQIGSEEQFKKILKENNVTEQRVNEDMASEVKLEKLINSLSVTKVSNAEIQKFYNENKAQFYTPESVQASHILINVNPEDIKREIVEADKKAQLSTADVEAKVKEEVAKKEKLAVELQQKAAKNPKSFAELAKQYSDDKGSGSQGGDLGFITRESVVKEFGDAAFKQKVGVVGPLVKSQFGYHIILVKDKAAEGTKPLAKVKNDLSAYLAQQKKIQAMQKLIEGLKDGAKIEFVDESLKPENLKKQIDEALPKQIEFEKKAAQEAQDKKELKKIK